MNWDDGPDPIRTFSPEEIRTLTEALLLLAREIHSGDWSSEPLTIDLVRKLHAKIFTGVRDHAGRIRNRDWGAEYLTFGPHRSFHRNSVMAELQGMFDALVRSDRSFVDNHDDPDYESAAFHVAVWAHATLIRIHPFEDGNGRAGRAFMNVLLVRFGLRPIAMELIKTEYIALLNDYFLSGSRRIQPLLDGILRLAVEQLPAS
jgi:Fic family protein